MPRAALGLRLLRAGVPALAPARLRAGLCSTPVPPVDSSAAPPAESAVAAAEVTSPPTEASASSDGNSAAPVSVASALLQRHGITCELIRELLPTDPTSSDPAESSDPATSLAEAELSPAFASRLSFLDALGVRNVGELLKEHPPLLSYDVRTQVAPRLGYLLNLGVADVGRVLEKCPAILGADLSEEFHQKVQILQSLGVKRIAKWIALNPRVILMDVETELRPAIELLRSVKGLDLSKVLDALPTVVFAGTGELEKKLEYLRGVGINNIGQALTKYPNLLGYTISSLESKVEFLKSRGFDKPGDLIARNPRLMSRPVGDLTPKLDFVLNTMGRSLDDIAEFPHILNYSLEHLQRRHAFVEDSGAEKKRLPRTFRASLSLFEKKVCKKPLGSFDDFVAQRGEPHLTPFARHGDTFMVRHQAKQAKDEKLAAELRETKAKLAELVQQAAVAAAPAAAETPPGA